MAEANGNRTHPRPSRPNTGFEDQGRHQAPVTSAKPFIALAPFIIRDPHALVNKPPRPFKIGFVSSPNPRSSPKTVKLALFGALAPPARNPQSPIAGVPTYPKLASFGFVLHTTPTRCLTDIVGVTRSVLAFPAVFGLQPPAASLLICDSYHVILVIHITNTAPQRQAKSGR